MSGRKSNIILVGMPGAGKSTIGVILAKIFGRYFVDTDILIQMKEKCTLQQIVDTRGYMELRRIEEEILLGIDTKNSVIATGGSAAYSEKAMNHLKTDGVVIFLDVALDILKSRITDYETRGIAKREDQSFEDLFIERRSLYELYADITIICDDKNHDEIAGEIIDKYKLL